MIKFTKPINLNGAELRDELRLNGVAITDDFNAIHIDGNSEFWLDIKETDQGKAKSVLAAHNGTTVAPEPNVADKLASVGLSVTDLKEALGL